MNPENEFSPELLDAKVVFGLEAQGHIPTIQKMLKEGANWDQIGEEIHWCASTARSYYETWAWRNKEDTIKKSEVLPLLAEAIQMLHELTADFEGYARYQPGRVIHFSNKLLASKIKKKGICPNCGGNGFISGDECSVCDGNGEILYEL